MTNRWPTARRAVGIFFPQREALKIDGHGYSPTILHRILHMVAVTSSYDVAAKTRAAYRFFDNVKVQPSKILQPHIEATKRRMKEQDVVLVLQDTTELDFGKHHPKDAGCLNKENRRGLYDHTHLAVTPEQLCLGVVGHKQYDRTPESRGKAKEREHWPLEQKESFRWLKGFRLASDLAGECPDTQIVSVADSEADIYDIFLEAEKHPTAADFVIRAKEDRCTPERDLAAGPSVYRKVRDEVSAAEVRIQKTIFLSKTPKREARKAEIQIRALRVTVKPPHTRSSLPAVTYNVVLVEEVGLARHHETGTAETSAHVIGIHASTGRAWRIQQPFE